MLVSGFFQPFQSLELNFFFSHQNKPKKKNQITFYIVVHVPAGVAETGSNLSHDCSFLSCISSNLYYLIYGLFFFFCYDILQLCLVYWLNIYYETERGFISLWYIAYNAIMLSLATFVA